MLLQLVVKAKFLVAFEWWGKRKFFLEDIRTCAKASQKRVLSAAWPSISAGSQ